MSNIGSWFRRIHIGAPETTGVTPLTTWHVCESEVADRLVTRCGREMRHRVDAPFEFAAGMLVAAKVCRYCSPA